MKYLTVITLLTALAFLIPAELNAQAPTFRKWEYVKANSAPIVLSIGHADPCVVDWDGDGTKDLLVGQFTSGMIRFYRNTGTNCFPVFTGFTYLQADGTNIVLPSG